MTIKLIWGLSAGLMTIAQIGSAQGISTDAANDKTYGNAVIFGTAPTQPSLAATSSQKSLPVADVANDPDTDIPTKSLDNSRMVVKPGNDPVGGISSPQLSIPEPSTAGLLVLGGGGLTAGALRRRKRSS